MRPGTGGGTPDLTVAGTKVNGHFYICDTAGSAAPNGTGTTPNDWDVRDWVIFADDGAGGGVDEWQKIDNSSLAGGSGTTNTITKWTNNQVIGNSTITDDGSTVTIADTVDFITQGNNTFGNTSADTTLAKGNVTLEQNLILAKGLSLGSSYGSAGQVLTSGGNINIANTWTTPTIGTVTSVGLTETGDALTITNSPITSTGNINIAGAGASTQYINGELNLVTFPTLDNYDYWTLSDDTTTVNISSTNTAKILGGTGITSIVSTADKSATIAIDIIGTDNAIAGLTAATPLGTDTLWFNDISDSNTIRKATIADIVDLGNETLSQVLSNGNTTGGTDIAVSAADDITFTDTSKALFGAGNDLKIYHDGSNSYITDSGTGNLIVASSAFQVKRGTDLLIETTSADNVKLYNNTDLRLETTQTGLTIHGNETVNGSIMAFSTATAPAVPPAAELLLRRDNGPSINNQIGKIQFQAENPVSSNNWVAGAQIIATAAATWSGTVKDTKLDFYTSEGNASSNRLTIQANGDALFRQNVEIDGNLTVDGAIIHGGGGGTAKGGTFVGSVNYTGTTQATLFTIKRNTTGQIIFDVFFNIRYSWWNC